MGRTLLVIDDDLDLLEVVTMILEGARYEVTAVSNGREALDAVASHMPDLILLDMKMPVMNGWEFAKELRGAFAHPAPIIVFTAAEDARKRAEEIGAEGWVSKPFEVDQLLAVVQRHLDASP